MTQWAYGITTVPSRLKDLFPRTLKSLQLAGFDRPHLFVDGCNQPGDYQPYGTEITCHWPNVRTAGNWVLSLQELYIRNPRAERFAIFQDDFVTSLNLRQYLDCCNYPNKGYWNLYTFPCNQELCPEGKTYQGWYPANQYGQGAVALVFNLEAVCTILANRQLVDRFQNEKRGHRAIDGGIVDALNKLGWKEYTHNPSLVQHTGLVSSMGNGRHALAKSFPGESFDLMTLVPNRPISDNSLAAWNIELASLEKAMKEDQERLRLAQTQAEKVKLQNHVSRYQKRIAIHLRDKSKRSSK